MQGNKINTRKLRLEDYGGSNNDRDEDNDWPSFRRGLHWKEAENNDEVRMKFESLNTTS